MCLCFICSCANDTSSWVPIPANSTDVTLDSHMNEDDNLESQVLFGHLENTLAVRCLARNGMAAVTREVKLVSNGKDKPQRHFPFTRFQGFLVTLLFPS